MQITQGDNTARFTAGKGYESDAPSFALWLNSAFLASKYAGEAEHRADLLAHGLTVDGVAPVPDPEPEPEAVEDEKKKVAAPNPHAYASAAEVTPLAEVKPIADGSLKKARAIADDLPKSDGSK